MQVGVNTLHVIQVLNAFNGALMLGIYLFVKAWPALSLTFLLHNPENYMTAGGIWAPLVGTFFLVLISLAVNSTHSLLGTAAAMDIGGRKMAACSAICGYWAWLSACWCWP